MNHFNHLKFSRMQEGAKSFQLSLVLKLQRIDFKLSQWSYINKQYIQKNRKILLI